MVPIAIATDLTLQRGKLSMEQTYCRGLLLNVTLLKQSMNPISLRKTNKKALEKNLHTVRQNSKHKAWVSPPRCYAKSPTVANTRPIPDLISCDRVTGMVVQIQAKFVSSIYLLQIEDSKG